MALSATVITAICWVRKSGPAALELYGKSFSRVAVAARLWAPNSLSKEAYCTRAAAAAAASSHDGARQQEPTG